MHYKTLLISVLLLFPFLGFSQSIHYPDTLCRIRLTDGSLIKGALISRDNSKWVLYSRSCGNVSVPLDSMKHVATNPVIKVSSHLKLKAPLSRNKLAWFDNPLPSRYFIAPSAIPMQKGDIIMFNSYLIYWQATFALGNHLSIGAGLNITPSFYGSIMSEPIPVLSVKEGSKINNWLHVGGEVVVTANPNSQNYFFNNEFFNSAPIPTAQVATLGLGLATAGNANNNITTGVGYYFINANPAPAPVFSLSAMLRASRRISLISETWVATKSGMDFLINDNGGIDNNAAYYGFVTSYGIRIMGRKVAFDMGFYNNQYAVQNIAIGYPYLGLTIKI